MNIDIKHDMLNFFLNEQNLGQKTAQTTVDQSAITSPEQKSLELDLQNEGSKNNDKKKYQDNKKKKQQPLSSSDKIERDPLKLLKIF